MEEHQEEVEGLEGTIEDTSSTEQPQHIPHPNRSTSTIARSNKNRSMRSHSLLHHPRGVMRPESVLRFTIHNMSGKNKYSPGGATAQSLTELICNEYGWPVEATKEKVERALKRAVREGRAEELQGEGELKRYIIPSGKIKECISKMKDRSNINPDLLQDIHRDLIKSTKRRKRL